MRTAAGGNAGGLSVLLDLLSALSVDCASTDQAFRRVSAQIECSEEEERRAQRRLRLELPLAKRWPSRNSSTRTLPGAYLGGLVRRAITSSVRSGRSRV